jgi:hypothetical protein
MGPIQRNLEQSGRALKLLHACKQYGRFDRNLPRLLAITTL